MKKRIYPTETILKKLFNLNEQPLKYKDVFYDTKDISLGKNNTYHRHRMLADEACILIPNPIILVSYEFERWTHYIDEDALIYYDKITKPYEYGIVTFRCNQNIDRELNNEVILPMHSKFMTMLRFSSNCRLYTEIFEQFDDCHDITHRIRTLRLT